MRKTSLRMDPKIIYQDSKLLILDKPSGWIVNEAQTTKNQPVIQSWIAKNFDFPLSKSREERSGIVHRIDKETSGILVVAKTLETFSYLQGQFKERKVKKNYTALAHGKVKAIDFQGEISVPVGRLPWRRDRFGVLAGGRSATTFFRVKGYYSKSKEEFSLLELFPKTGRTHQIRIHLKYIGHPIVSDEFYAGRKTARNDRVWCPRLFLHASKISLNLPDSKEPIEFESDLPKDLSLVLKSLNKLSLA